MTNVELAKLALKVLEKQKEYFGSRDRNVLIQSKALEGQLRKACESLVLADERVKLAAERQMTL